MEQSINKEIIQLAERIPNYSELSDKEKEYVCSLFGMAFVQGKMFQNQKMLNKFKNMRKNKND